MREDVVAAALAKVLLRVRGGTGLVLVFEDIFGNGVFSAIKGISGKMFGSMGDISGSGGAMTASPLTSA